MVLKIIAVIIALILIYVIVEIAIEYHQEKWWTFHYHQNFPFKWKGKLLWYSRSCAVVLFAFCKNTEGKWCVLANKRGDGCPDYNGYWNSPCGYLDFSESGEQACVRETREECGIDIPLKYIQFYSVNTNPNEDRQNVSLKYITVLKGDISMYSDFKTDKMEELEVEEIKWIPMDELDNYYWAFGHNAYIKEIFDNKIKNLGKEK